MKKPFQNQQASRKIGNLYVSVLYTLRQHVYSAVSFDWSHTDRSKQRLSPSLAVLCKEMSHPRAQGTEGTPLFLQFPLDGAMLDI